MSRITYAIVAHPPRYATREVEATYNNFIVTKRGQTYEWGRGDAGILGNNAATNRCTPSQVCGDYSFSKIAVGAITGYGITSGGTLYSWGFSVNGSLGNNSNNVAQSTPVAVCGGQNFCEISSFNFFALATNSSGQAYSWGEATFGVLGDNSVVNKSTPVAVCGNYTFCKVAAGQNHACALTNLGAGYCWGSGTLGETGNASLTNRSSPVAVSQGLLIYCQISAGVGHSMAITNAGALYSWGYNVSGQLGNNAVANASTPVSVVGARVFCYVSAGSNYSLGITSTGLLFAWGRNKYGNLGTNTVTNFSSPVAVCGGLSFSKVAAGEYCSLGLDTNGRFYAWGINIYPLLDNNLGQMLPVCCNLTICDVQVGLEHTLALTNSNVAYAWGEGALGKLGNNSILDIYSPTAVCGGLSFNVITAGVDHSCGITSTGVAYCWGSGVSGRLGLASQVCYSTPRAVCGGLTFSKINAGDVYTCASTSTGVLYCWGSGASGRLGRNSTANASTPVAVCGGGRVYCDIKTGNGHSLSVTNGGVLYSWGGNTSGTLGDNSVVAKSTPVAVCGGGRNYCVIDVSKETCQGAITNTGQLYMWGSNLYGNLGDNSTVSKSTPVAVCGGYTFCKIALGNGHTMAITNLGAMYGWGRNDYGQLGAGFGGDGQSYSTPVAVCGTLTFCNVSAGIYYTVAVTNTGVAYGWGDNVYGQLGGFRAYTPTLISFL
jgi:alpha-tubulin suppressor-like RCC1 family protein